MINKSQIILKADQSRVILLPLVLPGFNRVERIFKRIEGLTDTEVKEMLSSVNKKFRHRHKNFDSSLKRHFNIFAVQVTLGNRFDESRQLLAGALLSKEYSIQSAALFNPSIVSHPDQSGLEKGETRFVMSLRATGEGHVSSIVFRTGILSPDGSINLSPLTPYNVLGKFIPVGNNGTDYDLVFDQDSLIEERVIFPGTTIESMGMEDVRLVKFNDEKGTRFYGTYTAYDGRNIQSRLLETEDFCSFRIRSLTGVSASDKGMGLFPEKINGKYAIISRQGGDSISIMFSDDLYRWDNHELLMEPKYPFELVQIGNCGSPIKTEKGWLLLTHGVGPVREYFISAVLLDLEDPTRIISRLDRPIIAATRHEREGYVPNVVYSSGGMISADKLFIPYAMSDSRYRFAWIETDLLLDELLK
ncbi:MAG: glycoside hydrolase family 130 protein [Bacteroidales bacterium]|nr:glycoside hydrolase family 130 protein [Bacteroidales bacterium]